jgi:hypothetical protein
MERPNPNSFRNKRKFEIELAKYEDGTYNALRLFAKNTKVMVLTDLKALKRGYMWLEYERDGKPSGIADTRVEFFAINLDVRNRIYFMRAELLRKKARRFYKIKNIKKEDNVRYVKMYLTEFIRYD